jgi:hypothetical protein
MSSPQTLSVPKLKRQSSVHEYKEDTSKSVLNPDNTITYKQVNDILKESYNFDESMSSTSLDILALYLKGQKIIYTEAKTLCEKRLNTLMLPAIFISAVCSILNFILKEPPYGTIIIASLNAFNSFLLSLISYLKLDAKAEAHKTSAYKFQKLESMAEFHSGKSLFFKDSVDMLEFVQSIEKEIMEIRESNQFIIPEVIRLRYPKISSTNLFSMVKEIKNEELLVINNLKNAVQRLHSKIDRRNDLEKKIKELEISRREMQDYLRNLSVEIELFKCRKEKREEENEEEDNRQDNSDESESNSLNENLQYTEACVKFEQSSNILNYQLTELEELNKELMGCHECIYQLNMIKNRAFDTTVQHRNRYLNLSEVFKGEIDEEQTRKIDSVLNICDWFKT